MHYYVILIIVFFFSCEPKENVRVFISWPDTEYKPIYSWDKERQTFTGFDAEIIELIMHDANYNFNYVYPEIYSQFPRMDVLVNDNADLSIRSFSITNYRSSIIDFTIPYYEDDLALLVKQNSTVKSISDLKDLNILAFEHTTGHDFLIENQVTDNISINFPLKYEPDFQIGILDNHYDAIILDYSFLKDIADNDARFKIVLKGIVKDQWGIGIQKGNQKLQNDLNESIKRNLKNGKIQAIAKKYNM